MNPLFRHGQSERQLLTALPRAAQLARRAQPREVGEAGKVHITCTLVEGLGMQRILGMYSPERIIRNKISTAVH